MTLNEFIHEYSGKKIGTNPKNMGQCTGLVSEWLKVNNLPWIPGDAKELLNNADKNSYDVIFNDPNNVPEEGDIVVWSAGEGNGCGHCAVIKTADVMHFVSFDQDWPYDSACQIVRHDYFNVEGWLRPKTPQPSCEIQLQTANTLKDEFYNNWQSALHQISDLEQKLKDNGIS